MSIRFETVCTAQQTEGAALELPPVFKARDMSHREVITSNSDDFIPEYIMICKATQRMLDLTQTYFLLQLETPPLSIIGSLCLPCV